MSILQVLSGPLVGAFIGYVTNYIAVKMLFRPLNPVKIGKRTLPFTPGIIPRRKPALAKALGKAVGTTLLTKEDLKAILLCEEVKERITELVCTQLNALFDKEITVKEQALLLVEEEQYEEARQQMLDTMTDKILERVLEMEIGNFIIESAKKGIKEKVTNPFVTMFLNNDIIDSLAQPIGEYIEQAIQEDGREYIKPMVEKEIESFEEKSIREISKKIPFQFSKIREQIKSIYTKGMERFSDAVLEQFQVEEIVEQKVNEMSVKDLEQLVLSVMKDELQAIVNLGALIGFLLGILNICF